MISSIEMEKGIVVVVLVVMAAAAAICPPLVGGVAIEQGGETATKTVEDPPLIGGVFAEQAGEEAAKTAGEGLGDIARRAIHKADKIWNGSSSCKPCSFGDPLLLVCLLCISLLLIHVY